MPTGAVEPAIAGPVRQLHALVETAIDQGVFSGAQLEIGSRRHARVRRAFGTLSFADAAAVTDRTRFDLASLTKAIATSVVAMQSVARGKIRLTQTVGEILGPHRVHPSLRKLRVADLLRHRTGLVWWKPFFDLIPHRIHGSTAGRDRVRGLVAGLSAERAAHYAYSDPNYIMLDWLLESAWGRGLNQVFDELVREPLGLHARFVDSKSGESLADDVVATELTPWRGGLIRGQVHDGNTYAMGGVSGHAGLFANATDVGTIARALLEADSDGSSWLPQSVVHEFWDRVWLHQGRGRSGSHVLGWDTPSGPRSSAGQTVTRDAAVGHLGFTGTSLWIDRKREAYCVFLSNRVHPSRSDARIVPLRPQIHDLAWQIQDR